MKHTIAGPRGPIHYTRDEWGYPSIECRDRLDGTFARGYMHGLDRWVQIALTRAAARGRLMEMMGDKPLARAVDYAVRSLGFTVDAEAQVAAMAPEARTYLDAYLAGLAAGRAERGRPLVLRLGGIDDSPMSAEDFVAYYRLVAYFGLTSQKHMVGAVLSELAADGAPRETLELMIGDAAQALEPVDFADVHFVGPRFVPPTGAGGSNAFAVDGSRSASGNALLMSEFHMEVGRFPPVLYASHERYEDGAYYQGMSVPGFCWLSAGRTRRLSWGYTFSHADNVDVLLERCERGRCQMGAEWGEIAPRAEVVRIKGRPEPETWMFGDTEYGVLLGDAANVDGTYPCVRWAGIGEVSGDLLTSVTLADATSASEAAERQRQLLVIGLNAVHADADGHVAHALTGRIDQRPDGWRGVVPRRGWDLPGRSPAPLPESSRRVDVDPPGGQVVSANEHVDAPEGAPWMACPEPSYRHDRIDALLRGRDDLALADLAAVSYDGHDACAARLWPVWEPLLPECSERASIGEWVASGRPGDRGDDRRWSGLFHALHHEVTVELLARGLGRAAALRLTEELGMGYGFQHHLDRALALERLEALDSAALESVLTVAWPRALVQAAEGTFWAPVEEPFRNIVTEGKEPAWLGFSTRPIAFPGGPCSPFQARVVEFEGQRMVFGPAFHFVTDMGEEGSWYNIAGGASERRFGPGYGAGVDAWMQGRFLPLGNPTGPPPDVGEAATDNGRVPDNS